MRIHNGHRAKEIAKRMAQRGYQAAKERLRYVSKPYKSERERQEYEQAYQRGRAKGLRQRAFREGRRATAGRPQPRRYRYTPRQRRHVRVVYVASAPRRRRRTQRSTEPYDPFGYANRLLYG